jgi:predicted  nucleic acid-binding Zn-ribbon protein
MSPETDALPPELMAIDQDTDTAPASPSGTPAWDPCQPKPGETPKQALERLKLCVETRQKAKDAAENEAGNAQEQIDAIAQTVGELDQLIKDYEAAYPGLKATRDEHRKYLNHEKNCLEAILGAGNVAEIARIAKDLRKEISDLKKGLPGLEYNVTFWTKEVANRTKDRDARKNELDAWKQLIGQIGLAHSELDTLKGAITDAHGSGEFAVAYWLLTDEKKFAGIIDSKGWPKEPETWASPIPPSDYPKNLYNAIIEYSTAISRLQEAEDKLKAAQNALETLNTHIKTLEDSLEERILAELKKIKPPVASAA